MFGGLELETKVYLVNIFPDQLRPQTLMNDFLSVNEDPDKTEARIGELKDSVLREEGLRVPDERSFYLRFLRAGLSSPEDGLEIIKNYFLLRKNHFKYFKVCETKTRSKRSN